MATQIITSSGASFDTSKIADITLNTVNLLTLTKPATGATLTLIDGTTLTGPASSGTAATLANAETLTNKTLTAPVISYPIVTDAADAAVSPAAGIVVFTKGSASAHTLAAPTVLGQELTLCAGSAQAHVITATGLIDDGVTGGSKTTLTLGSFIGATVTLLAVQTGKWMVVAKNVCTIS